MLECTTPKISDLYSWLQIISQRLVFSRHRKTQRSEASLCVYLAVALLNSILLVHAKGTFLSNYQRINKLCASASFLGFIGYASDVYAMLYEAIELFGSDLNQKELSQIYFNPMRRVSVLSLHPIYNKLYEIHLCSSCFLTVSWYFFIADFKIRHSL